MRYKCPIVYCPRLFNAREMWKHLNDEHTLAERRQVPYDAIQPALRREMEAMGLLVDPRKKASRFRDRYPGLAW